MHEASLSMSQAVIGHKSHGPEQSNEAGLAHVGGGRPVLDNASGQVFALGTPPLAAHVDHGAHALFSQEQSVGTPNWHATDGNEGVHLTIERTETAAIHRTKQANPQYQRPVPEKLFKKQECGSGGLMRLLDKYDKERSVDNQDDVSSHDKHQRTKEKEEVCRPQGGED